MFDTVASEDTRSQIVLDPSHGVIYQFATYPPDGVYESGGWIYCKETSMGTPTFTAGRGTPFIQLGVGDHLNNISSTNNPSAPTPACSRSRPTTLAATTRTTRSRFAGRRRAREIR